MDELFKIKGFNQLINLIDSNNGIILDDLTESPLNYSVIKNILTTKII
jgi:hypothetical protein